MAPGDRTDPAKNHDTTKVSRTDLAQVVAEAKPAALKQVQGPGSPREYLLLRAEMVVGRDPGLDISVESQELSRRHMVVRKDGLEFVCTDMDSSNGVYLNGVRIHSAVLRDGDALQLGNVVFIYHQGKP